MNDKKINSENNIIELLNDYYNKNNFIVKNEVPNMGQSVDIVAKKGRWITCIEAKLFNWNRAIQQCNAHELVADFIYIAVSTKSISKNLHEKAKKKGYGLIHINPFNGEINIQLKAIKNNKYWVPQRNNFNRFFKEVENAY